jgi:N-acetylglutamate synthase-like GNAT family acetyltransferase
LGDRPVGYAKINVTQSDHYYERSWEMCAVRVLPRLRAHQVGTHLVRTVHETAVSNGVPAVYWHDAVNQVRPAARNDVLRLTQKVA